MTPNDIISASRAFVQAWRKDVVPEAEIARRSRICRQCSGRSKTTFAGILKRIIDKNGVAPELANYSCGVCKCPLLNLVVAKEPHVDSEREHKRRQKVNPNCWLLKK